MAEEFFGKDGGVAQVQPEPNQYLNYKNGSDFFNDHLLKSFQGDSINVGSSVFNLLPIIGTAPIINSQSKQSILVGHSN